MKQKKYGEWGKQLAGNSNLTSATILETFGIEDVVIVESTREVEKIRLKKVSCR